MSDGASLSFPSKGITIKSKTVFLFLLISMAFASPVYALSYFAYDHFGGTWYDANKTLGNTDDDAMCWAAAASNVLMATGWNAGFSNADTIFAEFQNHWQDAGQGVEAAWSWWFNGILPSQWALVDVPGSGNFYPNDLFATYYHHVGDDSLALSTIDELLHSGAGIILGITTESFTHIITVWGYEYDAEGNYLGIYVTDSDDDNVNSPLARLDYYPVTYSNQRWYLENYVCGTFPWVGNVWWIAFVDAVDRNPNLPIPNPPRLKTMPWIQLLLGD